jgi:hypothetical protein
LEEAMDNYETDVRSYERRIAEQERLAACHLANGNYERLLLTAGRLMSLHEALGEVRYQRERDARE